MNEKSDVFSFGIVLLELITGQPAIIKTSERIHIPQWVSPLIARGEITSVADPRLKEEYDANSAWKAVEIGMACTQDTSMERLTMSYVVNDLKGIEGESGIRESSGTKFKLKEGRNRHQI